MYRDSTVGVVVPAFNEGPFVGRVLDNIPDIVDRVYAVDDCSTDETWAEINRRATGVSKAEMVADGGSEDHRHLVPIRHSTNRGRGAAVKSGYARALHDEIDVVAVMDGDGQMDPDHLERLLDPVISGRADYAKGNRLARRAYWHGMSNWRLFGNVILTVLTNLASGFWGHRDSQNGYTAISADTLERLDLEALYDEYGFLNDMLINLNLLGARVADVEMPAVYGDEQSGIRYGSFVPSLSILLLRGFIRRIGHRHLVEPFHPLVILYSMGISGILLTVIASVSKRIRSLVSDRLLMLGLGSLLSFGLGLGLDIVENDDRVESDRHREPE